MQVTKNFQLQDSRFQAIKFITGNRKRYVKSLESYFKVIRNEVNN